MKTNSIFAFAVLSFLLILGLLTACQTPPITAYDSIAIGATKGEVLNEIGSPIRSYSRNGKEYWIYKMQTSSGAWIYQELIFKDGLVFRKVFPKQSAQPQHSDYEEIK